MTKPMTTWRQRTALGALAVIALALLGTVAPAGASTPVDGQAWTRTSTVPTFPSQSGRIYVAADGGVEAARAFVQPDAPAVTLTVSEVSDTGTLASGAAVQACPLTSPLTGSGELTADAAPSADCTSPVAAVRKDDGTWSYRLISTRSSVWRWCRC
jgi:hypothetical protein